MILKILRVPEPLRPASAIFYSFALSQQDTGNVYKANGLAHGQRRKLANTGTY